MGVMKRGDHTAHRIIVALVLLQLPSCRDCLLGGDDTCPELQEEFVRISSPSGTGYTGWVTAYGNYSDCPGANVRTTQAQNDSGSFSTVSAGAFMGTEIGRAHV